MINNENDLISFEVLSPEPVVQYLTSNTWIRQEDPSDKLSIWYKLDERNDIQRIWLPMDVGLVDYAQVMKRSLVTVANVEKLTNIQLLEQINTLTLGDIIRINTYDIQDHNSNSLPLDVGLMLIDQGRRLAAASAMSVLDPQEVYPSARAGIVNNYLQKLRLGQTEKGSYTVKFISPLSQEIAEQPPIPGVTPSSPFERQVVLKLIQGLEALRDVTEELHKAQRFDFTPFVETVKYGVSANLCEALVCEKTLHPMTVSVNWASTIAPPESQDITSVTIPTEYMGYISKAAIQFRQRNPETRTLRGYVKILRREAGASSGSISLVTTIDQQIRSVRMTLTEESYRIAVHAHESESVVSVRGRLVKEANRFHLRDPQDITVISTPPVQLDLL